MNALNALIAAFRDVLLLRRGPQDLPHSQVLLAVLSVLALLVGMLQAGFLVGGPVPFAQLLVQLLLLVALPALALKMAGLSPRLVQTATALVGTDIVFSVLALPVVAGFGERPADPADLQPLQLLFAFVSFALLAYLAAVKGHILRHAMDVPLRAGVLLAIAFFAIEVVIVLALFGGRSA